MHKETIDGVPNAIPGRTDIELEIYGMEGIPEKDMEERRRVLEQKNQGSGNKMPSCPVLLCSIPENYYACPHFQKLKRKSKTRMTLMSTMRMTNLVPPSSSLSQASSKQATPPLWPSLVCLLALVLWGYHRAATQVGKQWLNLNCSKQTIELILNNTVSCCLQRLQLLHSC